jgi:hypothetical protein
MRVLYMKDPRAPEGFSFAERRTWRTVIFSNVIAAMKQAITAMEDYEIDLEHDNNLVTQWLRVMLILSHIVIMFSRKRRSRIRKVSRDPICSLYKHYGSTAEFSSQSGGGTNMLYTTTYTSAYPGIIFPKLTAIVTLYQKTWSGCSYPTTCRQTLISCIAV